MLESSHFSKTRDMPNLSERIANSRLLYSLFQRDQRLAATRRLCLLGFLVFGTAAAFVLPRPTMISTDSAEYLIGARFIFAGAGYQTYNFDGEGTIPVIDWPPLFSSAVAAVMRLSDVSELTALKMLNLLSLLIFYLSFFPLLPRLFPGISFQTGAHFLLLSSPILWRYLNAAYSEPLFMGLLGLSFFCMFKAFEASPGAVRRLWMGAGGVATALLCLTRYAGFFMAASSFLFFLFRKGESPEREKVSSMLWFGTPVVLGTGFWLLRNKFLRGSFSFLEVSTAGARPVSFLAGEARFVRRCVEILFGYSTDHWPIPWLGFFPAVFFMSLVFILGICLWPRRNLLLDKRSLSFCHLTFLNIGVQIFFLNLLRLTKGFGETLRYFHVWLPFLYLSVLVLIQALILKKNSLRAGLRRFAVVSLAALLGISFSFHSFNLAKEIVFTLRRPSYPVPGVFIESFPHSPWVFDFARKEIQSNDILLSNTPALLSYLATRPCWSTATETVEAAARSRGFDNAPVALAEARHSGRSVYVVLEKKYACFHGPQPDWQDYLRNHPHLILREDPFAVAVQLLP